MPKKNTHEKQLELLKKGLALYKRCVEENKTMLGENTAAAFTKLINETEKMAYKNIHEALILADKIGDELEQYPLRMSLTFAKKAVELQLKDKKYDNQKSFLKKWSALLDQAEEYLNKGDTAKTEMILTNYFQEKMRKGFMGPYAG